MELQGLNLIGFSASGCGSSVFTAFDPSAGAPLEPAFVSATGDEIATAVGLATEAAPALAKLSGGEKERFLRCLAAKLEEHRAPLVERAARETGLPAARLEGEIARTAHQLRLYGEAARVGDWLDLRIETSDPQRSPLPKPDHRSMLRAIGPVVVFGASNFPFAYSVAGGDTASALAAGCPVLVKAHAAHPGTSELVGRLVVAAVRECGWPAGTFSLLFDSGFEVGQTLVQHPDVKAVGFTGSLKGGRALADLAAARPEPIPVYAEMGSINPVFVLPGAVAERGTQIAAGLQASATASVGQFCTNPGLLVLERSGAAQRFVGELIRRVATVPEGVMLTEGIARAFAAHTAQRARVPGVASLTTAAAGRRCGASPVWFETDAATFLARPALSEEIFGPSSLVVWCDHARELLAVARALPGSLTASVHCSSADQSGRLADLIDLLATKAGRVVQNGFPTGVEVSHAIVHAGPYPATSDGGRSTAVGTRALLRWARLVCYQNFADEFLPRELQDENPLGLRRLVDGAWHHGAIGAKR